MALGGVWSLVRIQSPRLVKSIDNLMIVDAFLFLYTLYFPSKYPYYKAHQVNHDVNH